LETVIPLFLACWMCA